MHPPLNPSVTVALKSSTHLPHPSPACDFRCNDGTCQPYSARCDGRADCPSGIDEAHCGSCKRTQFTCLTDGNCVDYLARCNGREECADGSDEALCEGERLM